MKKKELELSVVLPCLNEAETLATVIKKAQESIRLNKISGEVIVADNGSSDGSQKIAEKLGARVVPVDRKGYGSALMGGIEAAQGKYIIMGDADDSYDFANLMPFIEKLREGFDLVMGNRFKGGIAKGAMPWKHKYIGNPVLTFIGKLFFKSPANDFHCGLRGFSKDAYYKMNLVTTGMEFASEMVIKSTLNQLKITEVATTLAPDGRSRAPHLRSWRDGWRHLRFMLLYSPQWLFYYPGLVLMGIGATLTVSLFITEIRIGGHVLGIHSQLFSAVAIIIGFQAFQFSIFAHDFAARNGLLLGHGWNRKSVNTKYSLEKGVLLAFLLFLLGFATAVYITAEWGSSGFGNLDPRVGFKYVIPSVTLMVLGVQMFFGNFFLGLINMDHK